MRHLIQYLLIGVLLVLAGCSSGSSSGSSDELAEGSSGSGSGSPSTPADPPGSSGEQPTVSLTASEIQVDTGDSVTLTWSSAHADGCEASGGWSGPRATSGSELVGPLQTTQTFTLSCSGAGGRAVQMLSVTVIGTLQVSWQAPAENVDGTPVTSLSAYRIHVGESSRNYDDVVEVDGGATSHMLRLPTGRYYLAMTAINPDNEESGFSNEVRLVSR